MRVIHSVLILLLTLNVTLKSQEIKIYLLGDEETRAVDFGMRFYLDDEVIRSFVIENNSPDTVYTGDQLPTNGTFEYSSGDDRFVHFVNVENGIKAIPPGTSVTRKLRFFANNDQATDSIGLMLGKFALGVSNSRTANTVRDTVQFNVFGIASNKRIDMWKTEVDFDSVYVANPNGVSEKIFFRNNWTQKLDIINAELEVLTSELAGKEFFAQDLVFPVELQPRTDPGEGIENVEITYRPQDIGPDTAKYTIYTKPLGSEFDSTEVITSTLTGIGVEQRFRLNSCNYDFTPLSGKEVVVNVGRIQLGEVLNISGELENIGNFTPGILSQIIDGVGNEFEIIDSVKASIVHFQINETDDFEIQVTPQERGDFNIEYIIKTDLLEREIKGVPGEIFSEFKIRIVGNASQASIFVSADTLDFGSLSLSESCPNSDSKILYIKNTGNDLLQFDIYPETNGLGIYDVRINDEDRLIDPSETVSATITFEPPGLSRYEYDLIIESDLIGVDKFKTIRLLGEGVEPLPTSFTTEDQSFFPGSRISVPIIVDGERIRISDRFDAVLAYNPSLLLFDGFNTRGTAAENSDNYSQISANDGLGQLEIDLNMPDPQNFAQKDTLVTLYFRTFLGNAINTTITVEDPKFGSESCDDLVAVDINNGILALDSLCGLNYKVNAVQRSGMSLIAPNPVFNIIQFNYYSSKESTIAIQIVDQLSNPLKEIKIKVDQGYNPINIDTNELMTGSYLILIKSHENNSSQKFQVIK